MISVLHPTRGRPQKSRETIDKWVNNMRGPFAEVIVSCDEDDPYLKHYKYEFVYPPQIKGQFIVNKNRSCVDAINNAANVATGDVFVVVSDDTESFEGWDKMLSFDLEGKSDYLLKCPDGIQNYIVTMTIMDRKYYERDGFIYHPDFQHQFADTYLTCLADIRGRLIFSNLEFPHRHYSYSGGKEMPDALHRRNDATWMTGQDTFVRLMKQFTPEERARIKDRSMQGFMKRVGL